MNTAGDRPGKSGIDFCSRLVLMIISLSWFIKFCSILKAVVSPQAPTPLRLTRDEIFNGFHSELNRNCFRREYYYCQKSVRT